MSMDTRIDPPGNRVLQHRAEHEHLASQFLDRCRETDPKSPLRDINSEPSSERPRICPIRVAHPVYGGALNTSHGHPGPCRQTPFAIARTPGVNGGITGGIIRFFQAVTTALEPSKNVLWKLCQHGAAMTDSSRPEVAIQLSQSGPVNCAELKPHAKDDTRTPQWRTGF